MKKLLLFVLTSLFVGGALFAQTEESGKVKNEGNAAWRAKNYVYQKCENQSGQI